MDHHKKPGSPGDILKHHGVKGQKWGVRKEEDTGGGRITGKQAVEVNDVTKSFMAASMQLDAESKRFTPKQAEQNLAEAHAKFEAKFSDGPSKGKSSRPAKSGSGLAVRDKWDSLSPENKKKIIKAGAAIAITGALLYSGQRNKQAILAMAGKQISATQFNENVVHSQMHTWLGGNYAKGNAFTRPEFELPAGHQFYRLTTSVETGFREATYSTHSVEDANRYIANFRHEKGPGAKLNYVTFSSDQPTKVPDLTTVLSTLKEHVTETHSAPPSDKQVLRMYNRLSGGSWDSPEAKGLIAGLKKKGYGALVDEMDAGVIGESPIVFFNHEHATPKSVTKLTPDMIQNAEQNLIELTHRKV